MEPQTILVTLLGALATKLDHPWLIAGLAAVLLWWVWKDGAWHVFAKGKKPENP